MTRRKPRMGRPTMLTPQTRQRILDAIATGVPVTAAAVAAGLSERTFMNWQARGTAAAHLRESGQPVSERELPYLEFLEGCVRARAEGLETRLKKITEIAEGGFVVKEVERTYQSKQGPVTEVERQYSAPEWRALTWLVERTHRHEFGRADRVELTGAGGGPVAVSHAEVDALSARISANLSGRVIEGAVVERAVVEGGTASAVEPTVVERRERAS